MNDLGLKRRTRRCGIRRILPSLPVRFSTVKSFTVALRALPTVGALKRDGKPDHITYFDRPFAREHANRAQGHQVLGRTPGQPNQRFFDAVERVFALFDENKGRLWPQLIERARVLFLDSRAAATIADFKKVRAQLMARGA